jgi:hypothetical protein
MKRWIPSVLIGALIVITIVVQTSALTAWPTLARYCSPMLIVIQSVFLFSQSNARTMIIAILIASAVSLFSVLPFGFILFSVILATTALLLLRRPVFQHPGIMMSVVAMTVMTVVYHVCLFSFIALAQTTRVLSLGDIVWGASLAQLAAQVVIHAMIAALVMTLAQRVMRHDRFYLFDTTRDI